MKDPDWGKGYNYDKHVETLKLFSSSGPDFSDELVFITKKHYKEIMRPRWWELWRWPEYWRMLRGWRRDDRMDAAIIAKVLDLDEKTLLCEWRNRGEDRAVLSS